MDRDEAVRGFRRAVAMRALVADGRQRVIGAAVELLLAGVDEPSVTLLAGSDHADEREVGDLVDRAMRALGEPPVGPPEAAAVAIEDVARAYHRRSIARERAANEIWRIFASLGFPDGVEDVAYRADMVSCSPGPASDEDFDAAVEAFLAGRRASA